MTSYGNKYWHRPALLRTMRELDSPELEMYTLNRQETGRTSSAAESNRDSSQS